MPDIFSRQKRSEIMSRIRSCGTDIEQRLYLVVRVSLGHRWRVDLNVRDLPGQPDIVIPSLRIVIFADGCFYHCCPIHGHLPKSNRAYWTPKLQRNVRRDKAAQRQLRKAGYSVWRIWEHDLRPAVVEKTAVRLKRRLGSRIAQVRDFTESSSPF